MILPSIVDGMTVADFAICVCGGTGSTDWRDLYVIGVQNPAPPRIYMFDDLSLLPDDGNTIVRPTDIDPADPGRWILSGGAITPAVEYILFPFDFTTPTPQTIYTLIAGEMITDVELVIETIYDDPTATLAVGVFADTNRMIATWGNDPTALGNYGNNENYQFAVNTAVILTLAPGASSQGDGYVLLEIKRT